MSFKNNIYAITTTTTTTNIRNNIPALLCDNDSFD